MIFRRLAFFFALLSGLGTTQLPAFVDQYRQRLGGAIDELATIVSNFDSRSGQHGLSQAAGIDRLRANPDPIAHGEGEQMEQNVTRLQMLRESQEQFRSAGQVAALMVFATHYDSRIARGAYDDFQPAVPASPEAFVLGLIGFIFGGGIVHLTGHQVRRGRLRKGSTVPASVA